MDVENFREKGNESNKIQFFSEVQRPDIKMSYTYSKPAYHCSLSCTTLRSKDWHRNYLLELFPAYPSFLSYQRNCIRGTCMSKYSQIPDLAESQLGRDFALL